MLIDEYLPRYDVHECHAITIRAPAERVYKALRNTDFGRSPVTGVLLWLRSIPGRLVDRRNRRNTRQRRGGRVRSALTLDSILAGGFILLADEPGRELVLGAIGRFWTASGGLHRTDAAGFRDWRGKGFARAAWNFRLEPTARDSIRLSTETRVLCDDAASRRRFRVYWLVVRPFSGLIRREMLRAIKRAAELEGG